MENDDQPQTGQSDLVSPSRNLGPQSVFDRAAMLDRLAGDQELLAEIVELYVTEMPKMINALMLYLEDKDLAGAERQAHSIKGASANVSAEVVRGVAFEMEKLAKAGELDGIRGRLEELELAYQDFKNVVKCLEHETH